MACTLQEGGKKPLTCTLPRESPVHFTFKSIHVPQKKHIFPQMSSPNLSTLSPPPTPTPVLKQQGPSCTLRGAAMVAASSG